MRNGARAKVLVMTMDRPRCPGAARYQEARRNASTRKGGHQDRILRGSQPQCSAEERVDCSKREHYRLKKQNRSYRTYRTYIFQDFRT